MSSDRERPRRSMFVTRVALALALVLAAVLMVAGLAVLGYGYHTADRIFVGLSVQGVPVGGLSRSEAIDRLEQALVVEELPYVRLEADDQAWIYSSAVLGGSLILDEAVDQAWHIGRTDTFRHDLVTRARLLWRGYDIVPAFQLEPGLSIKPLRQIALKAGSPSRRAQVWVAGLRVHNDASQVGRELDIPATQAAIVEAVTDALGSSGWNDQPRWRTLMENRAPRTGHFPDDPIPVSVTLHATSPALAVVSEAHGQAEAILSGPVTLTYDELSSSDAGGTQRRTWAVDRAMLGSWMVITPQGIGDGTGATVTLDREAMTAYVAGLAAELDRPPRQGRYDYDAASGTLTATVAEQVGRTLDQQATLALLEAACTRTGDRQLALPVTRTEPPVTQAQLQALLPLELISTGETSFAGSSEARLHNIVVATEQFQGVAVAPNSRFSFVDHVGMVTIAGGYADGWVIVGNETVLGAGGGVCQVGTTFFRAVFWGGYPVVERTPHAYRVSWYEPPVGLDAAVFTPYVDIKFDNDRDTPILIQTEVDRATGRLFFRFYGRDAGRDVTLEGPILGQTKPAGEPVIEMDASLAPGQRVQDETAHDGLEVTVYRVITVGGDVVARERFFSDYAPWPARYREGPPR